MSIKQIEARNRSLEERKALRANIDEINQIAADNWHDETWRHEMAADLTETIYWGFEHENLVDLMCVVDRVGFNDRIGVKEVRGLRAFWVARGGYIEASTMRADTMELPRYTLGFQVGEFEDKLEVNFAETQTNLIDLGIQTMDAAINKMVLATFQAAIPSSSAYYSSGAGVSLANLNSAIREVRDASKMHEVTIVGRALQIEKLIDVILGTNVNGAGYVPQLNEDLVRRGVLGNYRGANIISLINHKDDQDISFFPANEVYVMARDAAKFGFFGTPKSKDWVEDDNWYWHYLQRQDCGMVVHRVDRARRLVDTSTPA